jgi:TM2 domain-containing membrane protein YozV
MRINFLVLVLVLFQYNWSIAQANEEKKDPAQAVLLSVLWPGIGQFYVGDPIKGTIMALGQTIFLVAYLDANSAVKTE